MTNFMISAAGVATRVLNTLVSATDAAGRKRNRGMADSRDTSKDLPAKQEQRCLAGHPRLAVVADEEMVKELA